MDSSVLLKDQIWFLRLCHHIPNELYLGLIHVDGPLCTQTCRNVKCDITIYIPMKQVGVVCSFSAVNLLTIMHVMNNIKCAETALQINSISSTTGSKVLVQ